MAENLVKNLPRKHNIADTDPLTYLQHNYSKPNVTIQLKSTATHEIDKIIHSLQSRDSHGYDEVSTRIVKISAPYILSPLILILNKILSTGVFPNRLKFSEIKPLYKKGIKTELSNYRPSPSYLPRKS